MNGEWVQSRKVGAGEDAEVWEGCFGEEVGGLTGEEVVAEVDGFVFPF